MANLKAKGEHSVGNPAFATTHWSVVVQAGGEPSSAAAVALEKLCRTYWFPLYAFLRRKGLAEEDAKDLTQEFFTRLLERNDFQAVDARRGKFRTFLLTALTHFLANERDRSRAAQTRGRKSHFFPSTPSHRNSFNALNPVQTCRRINFLISVGR